MMPEGQDSHRCRAGRRCSARSGKAAAATTKPRTLCAACISAIQEARDRLPRVRDAVAVFVGIKPTVPVVSKVAQSREPSSPLNLAAEEIVSDIDAVLSRCGGYLVRDLVSQPSTRFKVWRGGVEQVVYWDGVDVALQIGSVDRRAAKLLGFGQEWKRRALPCRKCGVSALGQLTGSETVECSHCGDRMTDADYQELCIHLSKGSINE